MRILLVQPNGRTAGHPPFQTCSLSRCLAALDEVARVTVATFAGLTEQLEVNPQLRQVSCHPPEFDWTHSFDGDRRPWATATQGALQATEELLDEHDVYEFMEAHPETLARWLLRRPRVRRRAVVTLNHLPLAELLPPRWFPPYGIRTRLLLWSERYLLRTTTTLVDAEQVADRVRARLPQAHVKAILHGADPVELPADAGPTAHLPTRNEARERLGLELDDTPALLVTGALQPRKFDLLLAALAEPPGELQLLVAGPMHGGYDVTRAVDAAGWTSRSTIRLGYLDRDALGLWCRAADAVVLAYPGSFIQHSALLMRATEFRVPVLASDTGQMGELVRESGLGYAFEPDNTAALREALGRFLRRTEDEQQELLCNLARFAQRWSWPAVARAHLELYRDVLAAAGR